MFPQFDREGQLRIVFTPNLKILSWEFCVRRHEELFPRRLVAPQVNQLLQVAQRCKSMISESRHDGISQSDMQANSVMVVTAGCQLARRLELQSLNDLGFSKWYVWCLHIADVINSMKELKDFSRSQKVSPIEGLAMMHVSAVRSLLSVLCQQPRQCMAAIFSSIELAPNLGIYYLGSIYGLNVWDLELLTSCFRIWDPGGENSGAKISRWPIVHITTLRTRLFLRGKHCKDYTFPDCCVPGMNVLCWCVVLNPNHPRALPIQRSIGEVSITVCQLKGILSVHL